LSTMCQHVSLPSLLQSGVQQIRAPFFGALEGLPAAPVGNFCPADRPRVPPIQFSHSFVCSIA
jgi:hypothetical protein